jgi:hypothetical protein
LLFARPESLVSGDRVFPDLQCGHAAVDFCKSRRSDGAATPTCLINIDGHDPGMMENAQLLLAKVSTIVVGVSRVPVPD